MQRINTLPFGDAVEKILEEYGEAKACHMTAYYVASQLQFLEGLADVEIVQGKFSLAPGIPCLWYHSWLCHDGIEFDPQAHLLGSLDGYPAYEEVARYTVADYAKLGSRFGCWDYFPELIERETIRAE